MDDSNLKWLIERSHNDFLTWVALWLACMVGIVSLLTAIIVKADALSRSHFSLFSLMYGGLVVGAIFSVWRLIRIIWWGVSWMIRIKDETLKKQLLDSRGDLSKLLVTVKVSDKEEKPKIRKIYGILITIVHVGPALGLFFLATHQWLNNILESLMLKPVYAIVLIVLIILGCFFLSAAVLYFAKRKKRGS